MPYEITYLMPDAAIVKIKQEDCLNYKLYGSFIDNNQQYVIRDVNICRGDTNYKELYLQKIKENKTINSEMSISEKMAIGLEILSGHKINFINTYSDNYVGVIVNYYIGENEFDATDISKLKQLDWKRGDVKNTWLFKYK